MPPVPPKPPARQANLMATVLAAPGPPRPDSINRRWGQISAVNAIGAGGGVTFRGATTAGTGSSTTSTGFNLPVPAGTSPGDIILVYVDQRNIGATVPAISGFLQVVETINGSATQAFYYREADGTEGANFPVAWTGAATCQAICLVYAGGDTIKILDPIPAASANNSTGSFAYFGPTTTVNGDTVVWFGAAKTQAVAGTPGAIGTPAGFTVEAGMGQTSTTAAATMSNCSVAAADQTGVLAGPLGTTTASYGGSSSDFLGSIVVAIPGTTPASAFPTVDVVINETTIPGARYLGSYFPTVSDTVIVDITNADPVVVGSMAAATPGATTAQFCTLYQANPQSLSNNQLTAINFDTVIEDPLGMYNSSTRRFTIPVAGRWRFDSQILMTQSAAGQAYIFIGDSATPPVAIRRGSQGSMIPCDLGLVIGLGLRCTAGQQVCIGVLQNGGTVLTRAVASPAVCWVDIHYEGP